MFRTTPNRNLLLSLLTLGALVATALAFTTIAQADEDHQIEIKAMIKLLLDGDDSDVEMIELDASDMEIGESQQLYTESGKEVVITRTEEGFEVMVDGEELDLPAIHQEKKVMVVKVDTECDEDEGDCEGLDLHEIFIHGEDGEHGLHNFVHSGEGHSVHKIVIGGDDHDGEHVFHHADGAAKKMIFVSADGETTHIDGEGEGFSWVSGGEHTFHHVDGDAKKVVFVSATGETTHIDGDADGFAWVSGDDAQILHLDGQSAADQLQESGALDELDEDTRERILEALRKHDDSSAKVRVIKTGKSESNEH